MAVAVGCRLPAVVGNNMQIHPRYELIIYVVRIPSTYRNYHELVILDSSNTASGSTCNLAASQQECQITVITNMDNYRLLKVIPS